MAIAARDAGFDVHVATRLADGGVAIEFAWICAASGPLHPGPHGSDGFGSEPSPPCEPFRIVLNPTSRIMSRCKASVLGSLAVMGRPGARVTALTGFGYLFISESLAVQVMRRMVGTLLRFLVNRPATVALVQNPDDGDALSRLGIEPDHLCLIAGSGVDVDRLQPLPEPDGPPTIAFVGRLLDDKGIRTLVAAHRLLRERGRSIRLLIAGTPDPANPTSISADEAAAWNAEAGIQWLGHVEDIAALWAKAHIAVLPSRREGLPKSLLEAAACGRAMVATDVPGCGEVVHSGETGLLVPVDDAPALAAAISVASAFGTLPSHTAAGGWSKGCCVTAKASCSTSNPGWTAQAYRPPLSCGGFRSLSTCS